MKSPLLAALVFLAASFAHAADMNNKTDEILIDQDRALAGGVTPGDTPGFPVTLSKPGRYRLAGNLTVSTPGAKAVVVTADGVNLDLGGFGIYGIVSCSGAAPAAISCAPASPGSAAVYGEQAHALTVRNGRVRGFVYGIFAGPSLVVENLHIEHMAIYGIASGGRSRIEDNMLEWIGGVGIATYGLIADNVLTWARQNGIQSGDGALIRGNVVHLAGGSGIYADVYGPAALQNNAVDVPVGAVPIQGGVKIGTNFCNNVAC